MKINRVFFYANGRGVHLYSLTLNLNMDKTDMWGGKLSDILISSTV